MAEKLAKRRTTWRLVVPTPPREIFAVMEQMCGIPPFRFEVSGRASARIVEYERNSLVGHWRQLARKDSEGRQRTDKEGAPQWKTRVRWMSCSAAETPAGTEVVVEASIGRGAVHRALQLLKVLDNGAWDTRTVYRERRIPPGPVTLVASWAGMRYPLFTEPRYDAPRGDAVLTATRMVAVSEHGGFIKVRLASGVEGYVERDQIVLAPPEATREAQARTAGLG
jgi:hypothetical protein